MNDDTTVDPVHVSTSLKDCPDSFISPAGGDSLQDSSDSFIGQLTVTIVARKLSETKLTVLPSTCLRQTTSLQITT